MVIGEHVTSWRYGLCPMTPRLEVRIDAAWFPLEMRMLRPITARTGSPHSTLPHSSGTLDKSFNIVAAR